MSFENVKTFDKQATKAIISKLDKLEASGDKSYAEELKDRIVKRTQLGKAVDDYGTAYPMPPLSPNYIETRKGNARWYTNKEGKRVKVNKTKGNGSYVKKPRLASTTTPSKSNLTATGQLLKSLTVVKVKVAVGVMYVFKVGDRRGLDMYNKPSNVTNSEIVEYQRRKGRNFLGFTKAQLNRISREIRQIIKKNLG